MATPGDYEHAGSRLRKRRKAMGLSQKQLADRAGISDRTLGAMERGIPADYQEVLALMEEVGWTRRSWLDLLAGGEATPVHVGLGDYVGEPLDDDGSDTGMTQDSEILEKLDAMHEDIASMNQRLATVEKRLDDRP